MVMEKMEQQQQCLLYCYHHLQENFRIFSVSLSVLAENYLIISFDKHN